MLNVIIVEDDLNIANLHKRFLERFSVFNVLTISTNIKDAIEAIETLKPDLVLLDIYLRDGSGIDLLDLVRKKNVKVDFIVISAAKDLETIRNIMHKGIFDYLIKPIIIDRLMNSLQKYIIFNQNIKSKKEVEQSDLDKIHHITVIETPNDKLPKGIDNITLRKILDELEKNNNYQTAEEIAKKIGASRNTARRYLEYLQELKIVDVDISYGKIGRPEKGFILVSKKIKIDKK